MNWEFSLKYLGDVAKGEVGSKLWMVKHYKEYGCDNFQNSLLGFDTNAVLLVQCFRHEVVLCGKNKVSTIWVLWVRKTTSFN